MKYKFYEDPGHGWIEVPVPELVTLDIAEEISSYSYISRDGLWAYLEEDCDLSVWATAKGFPYPEKRNEWAEFWETNIEKVYLDDEAFIRRLSPYH